MGFQSEDDAEFHCDRASALEGEGRYREAISHLESVIEVEPDNTRALISAGDLLTLYYDDLGLDPEAAWATALGYFDRALAREHELAEAWAGKSLTLLYQGRYSEVIAAAEEGLSVLPLRIGYAMCFGPVYTNVAEALYDRKVRSLVALRRRLEARQILATGLEACPGSIYLSRLINPDGSIRETEPD